MHLRKHDYGIDFPGSQAAAEAAQVGIADPRLRMETIIFSDSEAISMRCHLHEYPRIHARVKGRELITVDEIPMAREFLLHCRKAIEQGSFRQKLDRVVTKLDDSRNRNLPVFLDI